MTNSRLFAALAGIIVIACTMTPEPAPVVARPAAQPAAAEPPADPKRVYPVRRLAAPTPEAIQAYVEEVIGDRLGAATVAQARAPRNSIMAAAVPGRFNSGGPRVNVVIRTDGGWNGWRSGTAAPLPRDVSAEIDRLLASPAFRAEPDRYPAMDCPDSGASLMVIRHEGRLRITRQSCRPANLLGRLLTTVLEERVPI